LGIFVSEQEGSRRGGNEDTGTPRLRNIEGEAGLKRFQAKWGPVRVKKTRRINNLEPRFDSIETEKALDNLPQNQVSRAMTFTPPI